MSCWMVHQSSSIASFICCCLTQIIKYPLRPKAMLVIWEYGHIYPCNELYHFWSYWWWVIRKRRAVGECCWWVLLLVHAKLDLSTTKDKENVSNCQDPTKSHTDRGEQRQYQGKLWAKAKNKEEESSATTSTKRSILKWRRTIQAHIPRNYIRHV